MAEGVASMSDDQDTYDLNSGDKDDQADYNLGTGITNLGPEEQIDYIRSRGIDSKQYLKDRNKIGKYLFDQCHIANPKLPRLSALGDKRIIPPDFGHAFLTVNELKARAWLENDVPPLPEETATYVRIFKDLQGFYQQSSDFLEFDHDRILRHCNRRSIWTHAGVTEKSIDLSTARPIIHCIYPQRLLIGHDFQNPGIPVLQNQAPDHGQSSSPATCWDDLAFAQWQACNYLHKRETITPPNWVLIRSISSVEDAALIRSCINDGTTQLSPWPGKTFFAGAPGFEALIATAAGKANVHFMLCRRALEHWRNRTCLSITAFAMPNEDMPSLLFHWTHRSSKISAAQRSNMAHAKAKASGAREDWANRNHPMTKMPLKRGTGPGISEIIPDVVV